MTLSLKKYSPMDSFFELCGATQGQRCLFAYMETFQKKAKCNSFPNAGRSRHKASIQVLPTWLHATLPHQASTYPLQSLLAPCAASPHAAHPRDPHPPLYPSTAHVILCTREWQDLKTQIEHRPCQVFVQPPGLLGRKPFVISMQHKYTQDEKNQDVSALSGSTGLDSCLTLILDLAVGHLHR